MRLLSRMKGHFSDSSQIRSVGVRYLWSEKLEGGNAETWTDAMFGLRACKVRRRGDLEDGRRFRQRDRWRALGTLRQPVAYLFTDNSPPDSRRSPLTAELQGTARAPLVKKLGGCSTAQRLQRTCRNLSISCFSSTSTLTDRYFKNFVSDPLPTASRPTCHSCEPGEHPTDLPVEGRVSRACVYSPTRSVPRRVQRVAGE